MINRVILIVMDSVGVGYMPDSVQFNDAGVNTLSNIYKKSGGLKIPNLCSMGIGKITDTGCTNEWIVGCFGKMREQSPSKDSTAGHWELAGLILQSPFPTYPEGFPKAIIERFEKRINTKVIGNYPQSGTKILEELGHEHLKTGFPIIYTSADSVFQIAAHKDIVPLKKLYEYCIIARELLIGEHAVGRVIARPFTGSPGSFKRDNASRKDYSLEPLEETLLDTLKKEGLFTLGIGKVGDLFSHKGFTQEIHTDNNDDGMDKILDGLKNTRKQRGLIFANFVDFDMVYGHRRDVDGYAKALEEFDRRIIEVMVALKKDDLLIITADHGCDPTHETHTDHTREHVPLLIYGEVIKQGVDLGTRETFADCGQTIADILGVKKLRYGTSFKEDIL